MKKIVIITATLLALVACEKEEHYYIPKNRKPVIQNGDIVYFVNHQNNTLVDTFVVQRKDYDDYESWDKKPHYFEQVDLEYIKENTSSPYTLFYGLSAWRGENDFSSTTGEYVALITEESRTSYTINPDKTEITINGTTYSVFVANSVSPSPEFPNRVYYSYTKGILRYDYSDTNYYEIKK